MNMNGKCKTIIGTVGEEVELHQPLPDRDIMDVHEKKDTVKWMKHVSI